MSAPFERIIKVICSPHGAGRFIVEIHPSSNNCGIERKQKEFIEDAIRENLERDALAPSASPAKQEPK